MMKGLMPAEFNEVSAREQVQIILRQVNRIAKANSVIIKSLISNEQVQEQAIKTTKIILIEDHIDELKERMYNLKLHTTSALIYETMISNLGLQVDLLQKELDTLNK